MKIAVYHNQPSGGARRALYELGKRLARRHTVDVFTLATGDEAFLSSGDFAARVAVYPYRPRPPRRFALYLNDWRAYQSLRGLDAVCRRAAAEIDCGGYDVAYVDACRFVKAPSVLRYLRTPRAYYCHEPPRQLLEAICRPEAGPLSPYERLRLGLHRPTAGLLDGFRARTDRANVAHADLILTNSAHTQRLVEAVYGRQAALCRLGVDAGFFQPDSAPSGDYVLSVGALEPHKGFDFLVRSLGRCPPAQRPPLVIVSNAESPRLGRYLERLAEGLGVRLRILVGIPDQELRRLYQGAALFAYSPHQEPFGLVVLEAMACGLPVVAVAEGGVVESVVPGVSGLLTPREEGAFAEGLCRLLADGGLARSLGSEGRRLAEEVWSWERAAEGVEARLAALAGGARG